MNSSAFFRAIPITGAVIFLTLLWNGWQHSLSFYQFLFLISACLGTTLLLISPVWLIQRIGLRFLPWSRGVWTVAALLYFSLLLLIAADYKLYSLYGFHINGFVINLLLTPGGIESMGATGHFYFSITLMILAAAGIFTALLRFVPVEKLLPGRARSAALWVGVFAVSFLGQSYVYALAEYRYDRSILMLADRIAFQVPVTAKSFFEDMGVDKPPRSVLADVSQKTGKLDYPLAPLKVAATADHPNIVWLVAESWRADMLDPEIMPNTWAFAQEGLRGRRHYSGGNGTRMGLFSQFYSLYGSYWFDVLHEHRQPVLFDLLDQLGYDKKAITSARFSYPEFDQTIFSGFKADELRSFDEGKGWERDRVNVDALLDFMKSAQRPYFAFMFFESPHANYWFPPESVIRPDYLKDFDYATADIEGDIDLIKNRYVNACHHLDSQFKRVLDYLRANGQLDNTIVVITGDHGEEFMENGHWGHNSTFAQQQIRVPLIIAGAGVKKGVMDRMTSHVDLIPTLLPLLGVENAPEDYGFGQNLQAPDFDRPYSVVSDWHGSAVVTPRTKFILSEKAAISGSPVTDIGDHPLDENRIPPADSTVLAQYMRDYARYFQL